jgi:hypothetical protein
MLVYSRILFCYTGIAEVGMELQYTYWQEKDGWFLALHEKS